MANHMAEVAKMLGVEIDEEFEIDYPHGEVSTAKITKTGLHIICTNLKFNSSELDLISFNWLLNGSCTIKRKPWRPQVGQDYWVVSPKAKESIIVTVWINSCGDNSNYKIGNCYRTKEEAEANRDKWVAFYASDEVLEV